MINPPKSGPNNDNGLKTRFGSGQELLLVLLGEFFWRRNRTIQTSCLISALSALGVSENASRKAIFRFKERDLIKTERVGRSAMCALTGRAEKILHEGENRVYGFDGSPLEWNGDWLIVIVSVPESERNKRQRLQKEFRAYGLASPTQGIWITPNIRVPIQNIITELKLPTDVFSFVGQIGTVGSELALVSAAWDIEALRQEYESFVQVFSELDPKTDKDQFRAQINLVQSWRKFPFKDPRLPQKFLPKPWIGTEATRLFKSKRTKWSRGAFSYWDTLRK